MSFKLTIGKVAIAGVDLYTNEAIVGLVPLNKELIDSDYLRYALTVIAPRAESSHAVKGRTLNQQSLAGLLIPVPPLSRQRRIAATLKEQLAAVERARVAAEARLEASRALARSHLRRVFGGPRADDWRTARLGAVASVAGGIQKTPDRAPFRNHRPFLTVRNVQRGWLDLSEVERFEVSDVEVERLRLQHGDVLVVEGNGSVNEIGRNALFTIDDGQEWVHQNHIIRARLDGDQCEPRFVSMYLNSDAGRAQMIEKARTSSGLYTLSAQRVAQLEIPLPPLPRQCEITEALAMRLAAARASEPAAEGQVGAINALSNALLRRAFSGQA